MLILQRNNSFFFVFIFSVQKYILFLFLAIKNVTIKKPIKKNLFFQYICAFCHRQYVQNAKGANQNISIFNGGKLRELRNKKHLSIAELSKMSDVSTGLISQIERDMVIPSVVSLWRLAQALETNINYFFEDSAQEEQVIIRKGSHKTIIAHANTSYYKMLSPSFPEHLLDLTEVTLKSGCSYEHPPLSHEGEECGYVIKGELTVYLNGNEYVLQEGDSIYFNCSLPHKYINRSNADCVSIWAMTPAFF